MRSLMMATIAVASTVGGAAFVGVAQGPNLNCSPTDPVHDWVGTRSHGAYWMGSDEHDFGLGLLSQGDEAPAPASSSSAAGPGYPQTMTEVWFASASSWGSATVYDYAITCPLRPFCDGDFDVDADGDTVTDAVVPCPSPLDSPLPIWGDGDYEWGHGGALLPDDHHQGDDGYVTVADLLLGLGRFKAGRDGDDDGIILGNRDPKDCLSATYPTDGTFRQVRDATDGRVCDENGAAGPDDWATWIFILPYVDTGDDGSFDFPCPYVVVDLDVPDLEAHPECAVAILESLVLPSGVSPDVGVAYVGTAA